MTTTVDCCADAENEGVSDAVSFWLVDGETELDVTVVELALDVVDGDAFADKLTPILTESEAEALGSPLLVGEIVAVTSNAPLGLIEADEVGAGDKIIDEEGVLVKEGLGEELTGPKLTTTTSFDGVLEPVGVIDGD